MIKHLLRYLYSFFFLLALPLVFLRLLWRSIKAPAYRQRWAERLGIFSPLASKQKNGVWFHAVSLGESIAAIQVIKELHRRHPQKMITVTTTTPTGSAQIRKVLGNSVFHVYLPYDLPWTINAFLKKVQPKLCVILETELWPNLLHQCYRRNIPTIIVNARLSPKSARSYAKIKNYLRADMFNKISLVAAQAELDKQRFLDIGMESEKITVVGNLKFDLNIVPEQQYQGEQLHDFLQREVWIAASTHEGEEEKVLTAFAKVKQVLPNTLLVLVPRHPERFNRVANLVSAKGYKLVKRSEIKLFASETNTISAKAMVDGKEQFSSANEKDLSCLKAADVLLVDTMGELGTFYQVADVAFVGGSLVPVGGHNVLEAIAAAIPVVTGTYLHNFTEISDKMLAVGAMRTIGDVTELAEVVINWLQDKVKAKIIANKGKQVIAQNSGSTAKIVALIEKVVI